MVLKVVDPLVVLEVSAVEDFMNPAGVSPEDVPIDLAAHAKERGGKSEARQD